MVGRPGLGKGSAINPIVGILKRANTANILSDKLTIEFILEKLSQGFPHTGVGPTGGMTFGMDCSCLFVAPELSVFLRYPDSEIPDLTDLWDALSGKRMYGTRGKGMREVDSATPSMLGGCAPEWLVRAVPPNAIGGGFTRRVNFVYYDGEGQKKIPWPDNTDFDTLTEPLVQDLRAISKLHGEYKFDNNTKRIFEALYHDSNPNNHNDEATANYVISRWAHVCKVSMAIAASRRNDLVLLKLDMEEAIEAVESVTEGLRIVFRSIGEGDLTVVADKIIQYLEMAPGATFKQILGRVWKDINRDDLNVVLMTLRDGGIIDESSIGGTLIYKVVPQPVYKRHTMAMMP